MRVALDARMIEHSGIGTAIRGWIEGLSALSRWERPRMNLIGREELLRPYAQTLQAEVIPFDAPVYSLKEQMLFPQSNGRWDLLHCPHYAHPFRYRGAMLCTVHDRFHIKYGSVAKRVYQRFMLNRLKANERYIATVSDHVRDELIGIENFDPSRIVTIPHGLSNGEAQSGPSVNGFSDGRGDYLLWVGIHQPHKNLDRLLNALSRLNERGAVDFPVRLAGIAPRDVPHLQQIINEKKLDHAVSILPRFDHRERRAIFTAARAFVFPSIDEGFGFPPLEAMAFGVPCAVSGCPPMNRTCENAALFFDPYDEESIAQAIQLVMRDESLRQRLRARGLKHVRQFSWQVTAKKLIAAYEAALVLLLEADSR